MSLWTLISRRAVALCSATALLTLACGSSEGPTGPPADPDQARALVRQANTALETILFDLVNGNPQYPRDVDFTAPAGLYAQALQADSGNLDAHFGVGLTGLLTLTTDTEVNSAFDEWKLYLDNHSPFEVPTGTGRLLGVPVGLATGAAGLRLPFDLVPLSVVGAARLPLLGADPQISRVQAILREKALPALASARAHLQTTASDPGYVFVVTPRMQGDDLEIPRELDRTDVLALRAACSLLEAACRIAVSYELGFAAYDSVTLVSNLQRGSGWLALGNGGAGHMQAARTAFFDATDDVDRSLVSLLAETDLQDDDIIKIGPNDLARADVDSIRANLPNVRDALQSGYTRTDDWDNDPLTPDAPLRMNLGNWFTNPVQDWKALWPTYEVSTERRFDHVRFHYDGGQAPIEVTIASAGNYNAYYWVYGPKIFGSYSGDEVLRQPVTAFLDERIAALDFSRLHSLDAYASFSGFLNPGTQNILIDWNIWYSTGRVVLVPVITWTATTFENWIFPDPTLGGLLPDMQTTSQLMATFGIEAGQWERRWVLNWTGN